MHLNSCALEFIYTNTESVYTVDNEYNVKNDFKNNLKELFGDRLIDVDNNN